MTLLNAASAIHIRTGQGSATWGGGSAAWADPRVTWNASDGDQLVNRVYAGSRLLWPTGYPVLEPYGPAWALDTLQEANIGGPNNKTAAIKFKAPWSGTVTAVRQFLKNFESLNYGGGDGGDLTITLESDNAGVPSGTALFTATAISGAPPLTNDMNVRTLTTPWTVTAGTIYHIVYRNVDATPTVNWSSLNNSRTGTDYDPWQPKFPDNECTTLARVGTGAWTRWSGAHPIFDLTFADGTRYGVSWYDYNYSSPVLSGDTMLRMLFTVGGDTRYVNGVAVRFAKMLTNTGTDPITARLETGAGVEIESVNLDTSGTNAADNAANKVICGSWLSANYSTTRTLTSGQQYALRFSTPATSQYWTRPMKYNGGWSRACGFPDGYAQYSTNAGTSWAYLPSSTYNCSLQFYLIP